MSDSIYIKFKIRQSIEGTKRQDSHFPWRWQLLEEDTKGVFWDAVTGFFLTWVPVTWVYLPCEHLGFKYFHHMLYSNKKIFFFKKMHAYTKWGICWSPASPLELAINLVSASALKGQITKCLFQSHFWLPWTDAWSMIMWPYTLFLIIKCNNISNMNEVCHFILFLFSNVRKAFQL